MKYKPYPAYKDSGVEWLGEVPAHWIVRRLKHCLNLITEKTSRRDRPVALENVEGWSGRFIETASEFEGEGVAFVPGDILFGKLRPYLAKAYLAESHGEAVGDFHVLRPGKSITGRFAQYQILNRDFIAIADSSTFGAKMPRVGWEFMGNMGFLAPPGDEQTAIAIFLDRETAKLDTLIARQEKLIELLQEKRQALISHAVTKGLNPDAPMKDSGVAWLGEVPAHWEITPIKHIVSVPVTDGPHETPEFFDEGVPFVSAEAVSTGKIDFEKIRGFISTEDHRRYSLKYSPRIHDIYMVKSGATTGVSAIVETDLEFNIWSPLAVIRCGDAANPYFILNVIRSRNFQEAIALNWSFGTQQNIGMGVIQNLPVPIPPLEEQAEIASYLGAESNKLDTLIEKSRRSIELMREHRAALISAAVTGKIDVRGPAAERQAA